MRRPGNLISTLVAAVSIAAVAYAAEITPGATWYDTDGNPIHAHGGCIIKAGNIWYWYGENTRAMDVGQPYGAFNGMRCYSSPDLQAWTDEGIALEPRASGSLSQDGACYRPKTLYNSTTSTYVMLVSECCNHQAGLVFTTSPSPTGPFEYHSKWTGQSVMDLGAFTEDDGTAYVVFSNGNAHISIFRLSSDYLSVDGWVADVGNYCEEGPGVFKTDGRYFLITSGCTWWDPNQNHYRTATSLSGPWSSAVAFGNSTTYNSQSGFVLPVVGTEGTTFMYMGDRWDCPQHECDLSMSTYAWLPFKVDGSTLTLDWYDSWYLDPDAGTWSSMPVSVASPQDRLHPVNAGSNARGYDLQGRQLGVAASPTIVGAYVGLKGNGASPKLHVRPR